MIAATDINPHFLHKAEAGVFGEWSFRNVPDVLKQRYFSRTADGRYEITPEIKKLVNFRYLNLVDDVYPSPATDTNGMDIIFCRNVLMYFAPRQIDKVIANLSHALVDGGWLAVNPSEASKALFPQFINVNFPGAILFRKSEAPTRFEPRRPEYIPIPAHGLAEKYSSRAWPNDVATEVEPEPLQHDQPKAKAKPALNAAAESLYRQERYAKTGDTLLTSQAKDPWLLDDLPSLARAMANRGRLTEALAWCERWVAADKLDPAAHYLHAMVLIEQDKLRQARTSLQKAVYLDRDFVLAHFALGTLARRCGKPAEADRHFVNARHGLRTYQPNDLLPESDGMTAGRLAQILSAIINAEPML
jgi:chemotaxis protein methyltransferase CheR